MREGARTHPMRNSAPASIAACAFAAQVDVNESASLQSIGRNITPSGRLPAAVCPQLYAQLTCLRGVSACYYSEREGRARARARTRS